MNWFIIVLTVTFCSSPATDAVSNSSSYSITALLYAKSYVECIADSVCLRKCCAANYSMDGKKCVSKNDDFVVNLTVHEGRVPQNLPITDYTIGMINCNYGFYRLEPNLYNDDEFYLQTNGSLWKPITGELYGPHQYCVDHMGDNISSVFLCFTEESYQIPIGEKINVIGMIISMPFLLLTFLVYAVLPDRNLHGKCLMCYVSTLFGAYALLIFIQLYPNGIEPKACKALGIVCLFFFMVSFFWMSVMSIDIFLAFSGRRGFSGSRKQAEMKRFLLYNLYAWGMPLILVIIVTSLSVAPDINVNAWYNPGIGNGQCWFADGYPTLLYFYLPISLIIITNITLFGTTACKIKRVQQDTAMLRKDESKKHSYENDKQRFNLYVKLLLAMGVNWSMEIISWLVDWRIGDIPPAVWYLTDFCNALYGVFIFFIFVFKPNIWKLLKKRYYVMIGRPNLARTLTQSAYSRRTTASSLNHTISNDKSFANDSSVLTSEVA
ncbi:hypothetical protein FQR65_LT12135 [Abscondita terminalis]|nr:hypothetical protein FQR65_LT12135 [Abscondita terminalis]